MEKSEHIKELAKALSAAQGEMKGASKDSSNPFFKSKYADLASVWEAIRAPFSKNGLAISQVTSEDDKGLILNTMLMHSSGEWIMGELRINPVDQKPQTMGSAISYARRYALSAMAGVYAEDDDGNLASGKAATPNASQRPQSTTAPKAGPFKVPETVAKKTPPGFDPSEELPF